MNRQQPFNHETSVKPGRATNVQHPLQIRQVQMVHSKQAAGLHTGNVLFIRMDKPEADDRAGASIAKLALRPNSATFNSQRLSNPILIWKPRKGGAVIGPDHLPQSVFAGS